MNVMTPAGRALVARYGDGYEGSDFEADVATLEKALQAEGISLAARQINAVLPVTKITSTEFQQGVREGLLIALEQVTRP